MVTTLHANHRLPFLRHLKPVSRASRSPQPERLMSTFANQLKSEIARIAKKEVRAETSTLKKTSTQYRAEIAALKRRLAALEPIVGKLNKQTKKESKAVEPERTENLRFRVSGLANLRKKLGVTANEMGVLLGVSGQAVYKWEQGKARPRASQLQAIAAVRKLGKREVAERLAQ